MTVKNAQDMVDGGLEAVIGNYLRRFGSIRGSQAPRAFRSAGGPIVGSLVQSALLGSLGFGAGHLLAPLYTDDPKRKKAIRRTMAALGMMGGPLANMLPLGENLGKTMAEPGKAWNYGLLKSLNLPATEQGPFSVKASQLGMMAGEDPTGGLLAEGETFNQYTQDSFHRPSIAVGQTTELIRRSGLPASKANPLIMTMQEAAGGTRGLISPSNIFRTGMKLGIGYLVGRPAMGLTAKVLGAVAGTSRSTQKKLTRYGTLGIMLYNAFGGSR